MELEVSKSLLGLGDWERVVVKVVLAEWLSGLRELSNERTSVAAAEPRDVLVCRIMRQRILRKSRRKKSARLVRIFRSSSGIPT